MGLEEIIIKYQEGYNEPTMHKTQITTRINSFDVAMLDTLAHHFEQSRSHFMREILSGAIQDIWKEFKTEELEKQLQGNLEKLRKQIIEEGED